jgi:methylglyoxal/glyoxal reductase
MVDHLSLNSTKRLNNGRCIPRLGLGVFRAGQGDETVRAVGWALEAGYRHIDTARVYGNESDVGKALKASGLPRDDVYLTTKLWRQDFGYDAALRACDASLADLGVEAVDLYLLHWPSAATMGDTWKALERLLADGRCRSIGVSNFTNHHLDRLLSTAQVVPAVNQLEVHPFLQPRATLDACLAHDIAVEAWAPLTKGRRLNHPTIISIAEALNRTPAQVLIRWSLEHDFIVIPKSVNEVRIRENADVFSFELTPEQRRQLDGLHEDYRTSPGWDPSKEP